jgi:glycosyltransferase involved in cell wall biosynthesis
MSERLVSICMPCYNAGKYVAKALESVLAQSYTNIEIIVVDDRSDDESPEILGEYSTRGVTVISDKCGTASRARNRALKEAKGEYIKFMDADDLISPNMIESQLKALHEDANTVAVSEWGRFYGDDLSTYRPDPDETWTDLPGPDWLVRSYMRARPMMQAGMFLMPTPLLAKVGGWNERLTLIDDFEFFSRVISNADVKFVKEASLYYRSGLPGSLSARKSREARESECESLLLGTAHLLAKRNDTVARLACANMCQHMIYNVYPQHDDLAERLRQRVEECGGADIEPSGGRYFGKLRKVIGWKLARRLQSAAGR